MSMDDDMMDMDMDGAGGEMENDPMIDGEKKQAEDGRSKTSRKTEDLGTFTFNNINACFIISLLLTVSLGTIQFGYMIGSWNAASAAYGKRDGWDEDEQTSKVMLV